MAAFDPLGARASAADLLLELDLGIESKEASRIAVDRIAEVLMFSPEGDNHHNAAACPYCAPDYKRQVAAALDSIEWPTVPDDIAGTDKAAIWIAGRDAAVRAAVSA